VCQKQYHLFLLEKACLDDRFALRFSRGTLKRLLKIRFLGLLDTLFFSAPKKKKKKRKLSDAFYLLSSATVFSSIQFAVVMGQQLEWEATYLIL
jgi:hypothetical protein